MGSLGSVVSGNSVANNDVGISGAALVSDNSLTNNTTGLSFFSGGGYKGNVISGGSDPVVGGMNLGQNRCGSVICPGGQF